MSSCEHLRWPSLSIEQWGPTRQTLHRYLQIVGKIRMSLVPPRQHWWHTTLRLATRGLTTGPMPYEDGEVEILLDLLDHRLVVLTSDGRDCGFELGVRPACADFYRELFSALDDLAIAVRIRPVPYDLGAGPAFAEDTVHASYDPDAVTAYWRVLAGTGHVLENFASRFRGEASPVHLFWHRLDLAYTRHLRGGGDVVGGAVGAGPAVERSIAFGFGPGDERGVPYPAFYASTDPEPSRLVEHTLDPSQAHWWRNGTSHRAVLAYDVMRATPDPRQTLLDFYESAYVAATRR